jgi:hypothetical protein
MKKRWNKDENVNAGQYCLIIIKKSSPTAFVDDVSFTYV